MSDARSGEGILLDTCAFVWFLNDDDALISQVRVAIMNPANEVYVSAISAWEIGRKWSKGDLKLPGHPATVIPAARRAAGLTELPLTEDDALMAEKLPLLHKDPFDRMLMAQAINRNLVILTPDRAFEPYPVKTRW